MKPRRRTTKVAVLAGVGAIALAAGPATTSPAEGAPVPCPDGSPSTVSYRREDASKCELTVREGPLGLNALRIYNVYCPGQMTHEDAVALAMGIARNHASAPAFRGAIHEEFREHDLVPEFASVAHLFHYYCRRGDAQGLATHLKIALRGTRPSRVNEIAASCTLRGRGAPQIGGRRTFDFDYQCSSQFLSTDTREFIWETASRVLSKDFALGEGRKYCLHETTGIQCAPCRTSDKLVIRTIPMRSDERCPSGTVREVSRRLLLPRAPVVLPVKK